MKFKIIISFCLIYIFLFNQVIAGVLFSEIFPNTEDDTNLEYIELLNSGTIDLSLSGFILKDKATKEYVFGSGDILLAGERKKYFRSETKILLNNSGEEIYLYDNNGDLLDSYFYDSTIKGEKIFIIETSSGTIENFDGDLDSGTGTLEKNTGTGLIETSSGTIEKSDGDLDSGTGTLEKNTGTGLIETNSGTIENSDGDLDSGTGRLEENTGTGLIETSSGTIENSDLDLDSGTGILEENIGIENNLKLIFSFQNPSYILEKDKILEKYTCDNNKDECKINLDLRNSFTGSFKEKDYECNIDFGFNGWLNGEEKKCNPKTIIFPKGKYNLKFEIIEKNNSGNIFTGGFLLDNVIDEKIIEIVKEVEIEKIVEKNTCSSSGLGIINKIKIKEPKIIIQSGLDENNNCKKEECSINLKYEENNKLERCEWDFSGGEFKNDTNKKCNPGYVKYKKGNYKITLKVYEKDNKNNYKESVLEFTNIKINKIKDEEKNIFSKNKNIENNTDIIDDNYIDNNGLINENIILRNIKLGDVSVNPKGKDENEYIEIINYSSGIINLGGCSLDDILIKGSKKYNFKDDFVLEKNEKIKLYKKDTKIILNNKSDEVNLICDGNIIDKIEWDFDIEEGYILNNSKLIIREKIDNIKSFLKAEKEKIYQDKTIFKNNLNLDLNELNIYSGESKIKNILKAIIEVQGKIGSNKKLEKNKIICYDTCSINFDGSNSIGDIEKFIWDFGNGESYEGKNPGYIKYEKLGNYNVSLKVINKFNEENEVSFGVEYIVSSKKIKNKKGKNNFLNTNTDLNNSLSGSLENNNGNFLSKNEKINIGTNKKIEFLLYILIFVFSINLLVLILKREKLL